jgi:hypothetical protein
LRREREIALWKKPGGPMAEVLRANILAHFAFYRRSRLLMAFALAFLLLTGLSSLPALFNDDGVKTFNALQQIFSILNVFLLFLAGGLGLFIVSSHLRNRSLKMVFTKPCSPALWLASAILSGIIAYMVLLATLAHPAIAVTFALIFNAQMFYGAQMWTQAAIRAGSSSVALRVLEHIFHGLYLALPMIHAYGKQTEGINTSLRVLQGDWKYPLYSLGYVLVLTAFCYFVALFALQRKRHI